MYKRQGFEKRGKIPKIVAYLSFSAKPLVAHNPLDPKLCELTAEATGADIFNAELRLQQLPKTKMKPKKIESLQKKYENIPNEYLPSYPGILEYLEKLRKRKGKFDDDDDGDEDNELPVKKKKKQNPGRPKRVEKIEKSTIDMNLVAPFGARLLR